APRRPPARAAWAYRARLDAVRRQAAVDGQVIDPWHLAALIEGVRLRLDSPAMIDRGVVFMAAHPAFELYRWFPTPDAAQRAAIAAAAAHLDTFGDGWSPLIAGRDRGPCLARQRLRAGALPRRSRPVLAATAVDSPALPAAQRRRGLARRGTVGARAVD